MVVCLGGAPECYTAPPERWASLARRPPKCRRQFRGSMGSDGFEKVLIGTLGPRETFLGVAKRRAAKNIVLASGAKHTRG